MKTFGACFVLPLLGSLLSAHAVLAGPSPSSHMVVSDSIGVEKKDGKRFILHRVDEGQTLYSLARKYGRSVAEIKAANPDLKASVQYNQVVRIPIPDGTLTRKEERTVDKAIKKQEKEEKRATKVKPKPDVEPASVATKPSVKAQKNNDKDPKKTDDPARAGIHVVGSGQTLYSLAGRYSVSQSDLRKWNNLSNNNVLIGQALIVSEKAYQARTPSTPTPTVKTTEPAARPAVVHSAEPHTPEPRATPPATEPKPERHTEDDGINKTPTPPAENHRPDHEVASRPSPTSAKPLEPEVEAEPPRPGNDAPMPTRGRRISASGVAEMIEGADGSGKYLALHRTAPIGTLVQVRNEFNNQSIWVKVIGRLPNTGVNDKILIKLSTQAFAKLSPEDRRFRAEVSYIVR